MEMFEAVATHPSLVRSLWRWKLAPSPYRMGEN